MTYLKRILIAAAFFTVAYGHDVALAQSRSAAEPKIVLVRGLMDVFSTGLDDLSSRLRQAGYNDVTVTGLSGSTAVEENVIASRSQGDRSPVVLIGHSLGANTVIGIARRLQGRNIPVGLLVTFDTTEPLTIPGNVASYLNIYQQNGIGRATTPSAEFTGELASINLSNNPNVSHTNIEKLDSLHRLVLEKIALLDRPSSIKARSRQALRIN